MCAGTIAADELQVDRCVYVGLERVVASDGRAAPASRGGAHGRRHVPKGVAAREGGARARSDGSGARGVAVYVHRACEAVGGAKIGGALPVGDHRALGRRDDLSRSRGSRGGEDLRSIPVALWPPRTAGATCCCSRALPVGMCMNRPPATCTDSRKYLEKHKLSAGVSGGEALASVRAILTYALKFLRTHVPSRQTLSPPPRSRPRH